LVVKKSDFSQKTDFQPKKITELDSQKEIIPPIWTEDMPAYIEPFGKWGFQYPDDFIVSRSYIFPETSLDHPQLKISDGLVMSFHSYSYTDDLSVDLTEDTGENFEYELWDGENYRQYSTKIYFNKYTNYYALQGEIEPYLLGKNYQEFYSNGEGLPLTFTVSFQNASQLDDVKSILRTFVSDKNYTLDVSQNEYYRDRPKDYPDLSVKIPDSWQYLDNKNLSYTFYYPPSMRFSVIENEFLEGNYKVRDTNGIISFNNNPEYIGFSTSGALCANTRCYTIGLFALPGSKEIINVAKMADGSFRAVNYSDKISVSFSIPLDKLELLDEYLMIIQSVKVSPDW
jgi:hypothetical protein